MKAIVFLSLVVCTIARGQSPVTAEERKVAGEYFTSSDWVKAEAAYKSIATREPKNAGARMRWGQSLLGLKKYNEAIQALEESNKLSPNPQAMYSLASAYAATKNADKSFASLDQALIAGFGQRQTFKQDTNFDPIKSDPRFKSFAERFDKAVEPCKFLPEARQFDFWIGDWDAVGVNGQPAGKSHIEIMLGDCVIYENWTSAMPNEYAGKSFNFFNTTTKKWQQTWVDDKGGILEFIDGEYKDGKMVFITHPDPNNQITRLTFHNLEPKHIRQQFEVTSDNGKTWSTTTDLHYYKK